MSNTSLVNGDRFPPRTVVLCFDGTDGQYDATNTNVVKFFGLLRKDCPEQQVAYYQAGIGTYFAPGVVSQPLTRLASLLDQAIAWYLDAHVTAGYKFIMDNYRYGDKICLFGFSRGAYTARALAGMLTKVGLLPKDNIEQVGFAYKAFERDDEEGIRLAAGFKRTFSRDVKVDFVGVWDTVQSTGVLYDRPLPFTRSNTAIRVFRQALALDEHRSRFRPNLYQWSVRYDEPNNVAELAMKGFRTVLSTSGRFLKRIYPGPEPHADVPDGVCAEGGSTNNTLLDAEQAVTDVLEVWFSGCHSDIGGGNYQDDVQVSLAQITLHWMIEQVIESKCGIVFDDDQLRQIGFNLETYPERSDAIAPLVDELRTNPLWWILEFLPFSIPWQDADGVLHKGRSRSFNIGRGRVIPSERPKFHRTVKERMELLPGYKPHAIYNHHEVYV